MFEGNEVVARPWFFSLTFALAAVTIVSGCLAERTRLPAYPAFTLAISLFINPILTHWVSGHPLLGVVLDGSCCRARPPGLLSQHLLCSHAPGWAAGSGSSSAPPPPTRPPLVAGVE